MSLTDILNGYSEPTEKIAKSIEYYISNPYSIEDGLRYPLGENKLGNKIFIITKNDGGVSGINIRPESLFYDQTSNFGIKIHNSIDNSKNILEDSVLPILLYNEMIGIKLQKVKGHSSNLDQLKEVTIYVPCILYDKRTGAINYSIGNFMKFLNKYGKIDIPNGNIIDISNLKILDNYYSRLSTAFGDSSISKSYGFSDLDYKLRDIQEDYLDRGDSIKKVYAVPRDYLRTLGNIDLEKFDNIYVGSYAISSTDQKFRYKVYIPAIIKRVYGNMVTVLIPVSPYIKTIDIDYLSNDALAFMRRPIEVQNLQNSI